MKMTMSLLIALVFTLPSVQAGEQVKFNCVYKEKQQVRKGKRKKLKTYYNKLFKVSGKLDENGGGTLKLRGDYVFGDKKKHKMTFHRVERGENEAKFKFAKFHTKSAEEVKSGKWLEKYYKFSLPKDVFGGTEKKFRGYFGYFHSEVPNENIMMEFEKMDCTKS